MFPDSSSGAISIPPNAPKLGGATSRPPSTVGAELVTTETVPAQSMAATSDLPAPAVPVTRIR